MSSNNYIADLYVDIMIILFMTDAITLKAQLHGSGSSSCVLRNQSPSAHAGI